MLVIKHSLSSQSKTEMYGGVERPNKKNISSFGRISKSFEQMKDSFEQITDSFDQIKESFEQIKDLFGRIS